MFAWAVMMQGRSRHAIVEVGDWMQGVLVGLGILGLLSAVWIFARHREAKWRWLFLANSLPLVLLTAVAWLWGSFWIWAGP